MNIQVFKEARKIWEQLTENAAIEVVDNIQMELAIHKKLLSFFQVGDYYYYILNLTNASVELVSNEIETVLGYHPSLFNLEFYLNKVHPEDQPYLLNFENYGANFYRQLPIDKILKYNARYNFRVQKSNGQYIRVLHQAMVLQHDAAGRSIITISVDTDITHLKLEGKPTLSFIGLEGEPSYIDVDVAELFSPANSGKDVLTKREKEILYLMIDGKLNKEISDILSISYETVKTHRKNMVQKAGVKNAGELIAAAIRKGWV